MKRRVKPMHLEFPLFRWFRAFLEFGAGFTFCIALIYLIATWDIRGAVAVVVPLLATYISIAALFFNRARALPHGPSKVRSLYVAERAVQAAVFTLVGIIIGVVLFAWQAWFTHPSTPTGPWRFIYALPVMFIQVGYVCFTFALRVIAREFMHPVDVKEIAKRIRNAP